MSDWVIRPLETPDEFAACLAVQEEVWGAGFSEKVPIAILRTTRQLGGVVSGAFDAGSRLLGFVFGITGWRAGEPVHWSDMLAVRPAERDRGIGEALKLHQRKLLLDLGVTRAEWTFDPLEARNAWLNFHRLGAVSHEYVRDYYSESDSPLHAGVGTDRLLVTWDLDSPRVAERVGSSSPQPPPGDWSAAPVANPARHIEDVIECDDARLDLDSPDVLVIVPSDIQRLKRIDPSLAARWRDVTRTAIEAYLPGRAVTDVVRSEHWSALVLVSVTSGTPV